MDAYGYDRELEDRDRALESMERQMDRLDAQYHDALARIRQLESDNQSLTQEITFLSEELARARSGGGSLGFFD